MTMLFSITFAILLVINHSETISSCQNRRGGGESMVLFGVPSDISDCTGRIEY
jgi:hypothetical protein